jgi:hypothetical protein
VCYAISAVINTFGHVWTRFERQERVIVAGYALRLGPLILAAVAQRSDELPLGINVGNLIAQVITFFVVLIILAKWVFPVLTKTLDNRARVIQEGVENTERSRRELAEAQRRIEGIFEEARQQSQQTLAQATQTAEKLRTEI